MTKSRPRKGKDKAMEELKRTTVELDPDLWEAVKIRAAQERTTFRTVLQDALRGYLKLPARERRS